MGLRKTIYQKAESYLQAFFDKEDAERIHGTKTELFPIPGEEPVNVNGAAH